MYKLKNQKGFIGLLVLLIATAIIGYLSYNALIQEGDNPQTEGLINQIEKAKDLSGMVEKRAREFQKEIGEIGEYVDDIVDKQNKVNVTLRISAENSAEYIKELDKEKSAFDLMKLINEDSGDFSFKYQESSMGAFIEEINGVKNDASNNMYWMFYVNEKMAEVGASQYILLNNDIIEWKYEDTSGMWQ